MVIKYTNIIIYTMYSECKTKASRMPFCRVSDTYLLYCEYSHNYIECWSRRKFGVCTDSTSVYVV